MKTSKMEFIIIGVILLLSLIGFLIFNNIFNASSNAIARVQHWYRDENGNNVNYDLVEIDFKSKKVKKVNNQKNVSNNYGEFPIINKDDNKIIVLGEYIDPKDNLRVKIEIEYNFDNNTIQIIKEKSPKNICSKMGISKGKPLICIPNQIKIVFDVIRTDVDYEF